MLSPQDLVEQFYDVVDLGGGIYRCQDVLPKVTIYNYVQLGGMASLQNDLLLVSEQRADDEFARLIFSSLSETPEAIVLSVQSIPSNKYQFHSVLLAATKYHSYFKGRLDDKRARLILCLPIHRCEFSGDETVESFITLRREIVPTLDWEREVHPKIMLRFDNSRTRSGTGKDYVFAKFTTVIREIDNLRGVSKGFIELINYKGGLGHF